jgi:hypothetical protein
MLERRGGVPGLFERRVRGGGDQAVRAVRMNAKGAKDAKGRNAEGTIAGDDPDRRQGGMSKREEVSWAAPMSL